MNVQPITVTEFRANMKELLDQTKNGPIYIRRGWIVWKVEMVGKGTIALPPPVKEKLDTMREKIEPVATQQIGKSCCYKDKRCQHWNWDEVNQWYFNYLTGEKRVVE